MVVLVIEEQNVITIDIEEPENVQLATNSEITLFSSLNDVTLTSLANNDSLFWNSTTSMWNNKIPSAARTALGLGTMAIQNAASVAITGGTIAGITDLALADGGTGASDAPTARTNLGLGTIATQAATSVNIDGGAIDGTTIGVTSASTGAFTTIDATGSVTLNDNILTRPELKDYAETNTTPSSSSGVLTLDLENGNVFEVILTENVTTTNFNNPPATGKGGSFTLILKQDAGAGHTFVWPASVDWAGGAAPTLTTTTNAVDILTFVTTDAGTRWYGFLAGADLK